MRSWVTTVLAVLVVVGGGCKGSGGGPSVGDPGIGNGAAPDARGLAAALPQVTVAAATREPSDRPAVELLVLVDAAGRTSLAAAPDSWAHLGDADPRARAVGANDHDNLYKTIREGRMLRTPGEEVIKHVTAPEPMDLTDPDQPARTAGQDDPPPPEPEDDGDESGGTGTAMALEEGKMGKDSNRVEGQYQMPRGTDSERDARRKHGFCSVFWSVGELEDPPGTDRTPSPARLCQVPALLDSPSLRLEPAYAVLMAAGAAKVAGLFDLLPDLQAIAVGHAGTIRVLRYHLDRVRDRDTVDAEPPPWLEVHFTAAGVELEAVPDVPVATTVEPAAFAAAYAKVLAAHGLDRDHSVDILVTPATTMQDLVNVMVALDQAGAASIALGLAPEVDSPQAAARGHARK